MDGYVLQDGACMEQCSASFYQDLGLCKSKCLQPFSVLTQAFISSDCHCSEKEGVHGKFSLWLFIQFLVSFLRAFLCYHANVPSFLLPCLNLYAKLLQSCPTLWESMDCSLSGSSVHRILQERILEWVAIFSSRWSSQPSNLASVSYVSCICRGVLYH